LRDHAAYVSEAGDSAPPPADGEVIPNLPRTRPQRRSARRATAASSTSSQSSPPAGSSRPARSATRSPKPGAAKRTRARPASPLQGYEAEDEQATVEDGGGLLGEAVATAVGLARGGAGLGCRVLGGTLRRLRP
jgi:hypothetical protein